MVGRADASAKHRQSRSIMKQGRRLTVFVSSSVRGNEDTLNMIYTLLTALGYEVWMSYKGTVPIFSDRSNFENCLAAIENCDLFLGLITPNYGSGKDGREPSITHKELRKAIQLKKPRWVLAHDYVIFARSFYKNLRYKGRVAGRQLSLKKNSSFNDIRIIDMYDEAIEDHKPLCERKGNWVQPFMSEKDVNTFIMAQFSRYEYIEELMREKKSKGVVISQTIQKKGGQP